MQWTRTWLAIISLLLFFSLRSDAQSWQFRWQKGQVLAYKVQHSTNVTETIGKSAVTSASNLALVKRWQVAEVDAMGVATLKLSLSSMKNEQIRPNGEKLLFDSENPDKSSPEFREAMGKYVGMVLAEIKIDPQGRVVEVLRGQANRFESEPPFIILLPTKIPGEGQAWQRTYEVTLDPPQGAGEKFAGVQSFTVKKIAAGKATLAVATQFKSLPEALADQVPLLPRMVQGEIIFDVQSGRLASAQLTIDKTLQNHQGEGSSYQFKSQYVEQLVGVGP